MGANLSNSNLDGEDDLAPMGEINVTPLVDVMLVLLVIFMVAAPLMIAGVPVNLPRSAAAKQNPPQKPLVITLAADSKLYIRSEEAGWDNLETRLQALRAIEGDAVAYVRADEAVPYGKVMDILGRVGRSGYGRISLLSQPEPGSGAVSKQ
ncbi:MAG: biopolymer transporter ExbD [Rhodomicrobium sp.]